MDENPAPEFKVVMFGHSGVGKTSLVQALIGDPFSEGIRPTVANAYHRYCVQLRDGPAFLNIWDTAGQEQYRSLCGLYTRNAHGAIIVIDLHAQDPFACLDELYNTLMELDTDAPLEIQVAANKADLIDADFDCRPIEAWAERRNVRWMKTSAKTNIGISALFAAMGEVLAENHRKATPRKRVVAPTVALDEPADNKCC
jgi:small GTP-binding protein